MKKLLFGACSLLLIAGASCSKDNDANTYPKELCDSISMYSGRTIGAYVLSDFINYNSSAETPMSKDDILKGIQIAFANADNEGTVAGIQIGSQILSQLERYEKDGITIDRNVVLKNFRKVFETDTFNVESLAADNAVMSSLVKQAQNIKEEREQAEQAEQAEAAKAENDKYLADLMANDPEIKTTESGLAYKITNEGTEPSVTDNSQIQVNYVGRLIDGTVFDQTDEGQPATFTTAGVIPGFAEGLKLLNKGSKAVLYIPSDLAYGPKGVAQAGIGPNAMLIFDVEIVDVVNPED